jgi:hypothetical protein
MRQVKPEEFLATLTDKQRAEFMQVASNGITDNVKEKLSSLPFKDDGIAQVAFFIVQNYNGHDHVHCMTAFIYKLGLSPDGINITVDATTITVFDSCDEAEAKRLTYQ